MTVEQLIAELMRQPSDAKVYLPDRDYGPFECSAVEFSEGDSLTEEPAGVYLNGGIYFNGDRPEGR